MKLDDLGLILTSVALSACAQLAMKTGMSAMAPRSTALPDTGVFQLLLPFASPLVWLGLACYGLGALVWLRVLASLDVGQAYPFVALGFVLTLLLGIWVLGEPLHLTRWLGVGLILGGVTLVGMK